MGYGASSAESYPVLLRLWTLLLLLLLLRLRATGASVHLARGCTDMDGPVPWLTRISSTPRPIGLQARRALLAVREKSGPLTTPGRSESDADADADMLSSTDGATTARRSPRPGSSENPPAGVSLVGVSLTRRDAFTVRFQTR